MPKSPFLTKNKPKKIMSENNKRKQKFAIMNYYKRRNELEMQGRKSGKEK